ncbi:MAG TPA: lysophospholipid acyltransferase family protein [Blastocatellia bacterium]|nr:lysophospholipid acyltransferase family protein [Blastocatellia bacterium]
MIRYYWTLIVVVLLLLFIGVPIVFLGYLLRRLFGIEDFVHPFAKFGCKVWIRSFGARVHVSGREHLDPNQAYVFAANHQSNVDPPLLFAYLGPITGAIAKKELTKFPVIKQGFPLAHVVPIDRRNRESAIESTRRGAAELKKGYSLMAFPEGTRTVDGCVKEFKKGVFFMALEAGVPVVPVVVNDTRLVWRKGAKIVRAGDVYLEILPPITTEGYNDGNIEALVERVRSQIVPRVRTDSH